MTALKTQPHDGDVEAFIANVENPVRQQDARALLDLFDRATGLPPVMWGPSIIGYGQYHYRYESGREGDWMLTGFSPRKANLSVYLMPGVDRYANTLANLGPHKTAVSCLYITRLDRIDMSILETVVRQSVADMAVLYPES